MKKPKIDLSKEGIQRFFLHHVEKLILVLAIAGLFAFFWLGFTTEKYSTIDPQQLSQKADRASQHVRNTESWTKVADLRKARDNADSIITNTKDFDPMGYPFGKVRGSAVQTRGLREDPKLLAAVPKKPVIDVIRAPVLINRRDRTPTDLEELELAKTRGSSSDDEQDEMEVKYGDSISQLQNLVFSGIQSDTAGISPGRHTSVVVNMVSVRALINFKELWDEYESKFKNSFGYFPDRDRPTFQLVEVQRREVGSEDWTNITSRLTRHANLYAVRSPEVISPVNYDASLCANIPPLSMVDYRSIASHPDLDPRDFDGKMSEEEDDTSDEDDQGSDTRNDLFDDSDPEENEQDEMETNPLDNPVRLGSDNRLYDGSLDAEKPAGDLKLVRFFDLGVKDNTEYEYRFRIWSDDPNNQSESEEVSTGSGRSGRGGGGAGLEGGGGGAFGGGGGNFGGGGTPPGGRGGAPPGGRGGGVPPGGRGGGEGGQGSTGGLGGGSGNQSGTGSAPKTFTEIPITDSMKDISVRNRIDEEQKRYETDKVLKEFFDNVLTSTGIDLRYSRATDWVEVKVKVPSVRGADAVLGDIVSRPSRNQNGESVYLADPQANVVVADWSGKFGTLVSMHKSVFKGDSLAFELPSITHVLSIAENTVRKLKEYTFESDRVVLDLMGGEKIPYRQSPAEYTIPGEVLIMDLDGKFSIRNSSEDRDEYLTWRFQEDQTSEYNVKKRKARNSDDDRGSRGDDDNPFGRGGGGFGRGG